ncbi:MAG TPA: hypothetical protein VFZ21_05810 [Gemmatimonadaceae bacterium]|jgi:hypothetical protein|nr:hypothetical protein [Gemmatimonadaceae bacterium]
MTLGTGARFAVVAFLLAGCGNTETAQTDSVTSAAPAAAAAPNMVTFTADDFTFQGPDTIPAGLTMFHLVANGQDLHHLQLVKLEEGRTYADLQAALKAGGPPPQWAVAYGGVNPPAPGGMTMATQTMEPGNYAVVCFVEGPDKVPHIAKGMMKPLTVTPVENANMTEPSADVTMTLSDYTFAFSKPLAAGRQMIKVENVATQPHEVALVQLEPGKTLEDLGKWVQDFKGPPPGKPLGGIPAVKPGKNAYFEVDLAPGTYGLICFVPDAKDGKPHHAHGMAQQLTIS